MEPKAERPLSLAKFASVTDLENNQVTTIENPSLAAQIHYPASLQDWPIEYMVAFHTKVA